MNEAVISDNKLYRYWLTREIKLADDAVRENLGACSFIMLNPSTADADVDDHTIRKCMGFCRRWNFNKLIVVNVYALRSTDPKGLWGITDPVGVGNENYIAKAIQRSTRTVFAWGRHAKPEHTAVVYGIATALGRNPVCLGVNSDNSPKHPLTLAYATPAKEYLF